MVATYSGPDNPDAAQIPASALNGGFQAQVNMTANNVTLAAGTNSTINATQAFEMTMGTLTFNAGATLTTGTATSFGNALVRFGHELCRAAGSSYTVVANGTNDVALGRLTTTGTSTIVKQGTQNLILDSTTAPTLVGTTTFDIQGGRLVASTLNAGTNPLGANSIINFSTTAATNPATLQLRFGAVNPTFANTLNANQNGVVELTTFNAATQTANWGTAGTTSVTVAATKQLIYDVFQNVTLNVVGNITGSGTI